VYARITLGLIHLITAGFAEHGQVCTLCLRAVSLLDSPSEFDTERNFQHPIWCCIAYSLFVPGSVASEAHLMSSSSSVRHARKCQVMHTWYPYLGSSLRFQHICCVGLVQQRRASLTPERRLTCFDLKIPLPDSNCKLLQIQQRQSILLRFALHL
jgi:hypothetical protein